MLTQESFYFRSFVLRFVALLFIGDIKVDSFAIRGAYNATDAPSQDMAAEESLHLEVRHDFKRPNGIDGNVSNKSNEHLTTDNSDYTKEIKSIATPMLSQIAATTWLTESYMNKEGVGTPSGIIGNVSSPRESSRVKDASAEVPKNVKSQENYIVPALKMSKDGVTDDTDHSMIVSIEEIKAKALLKDESATRDTSTVTDDTNIPTEDAIVDRNLPNTTIMYSTLLQGTEYPTVSTKKNNNTNTSLPSWKKYIVIDRKRVPSNDDIKVSTGRYEEMFNAETRVTIKDSDTFGAIDIEETTEDLLRSTLKTTSVDFINSSYNQSMKGAYQIEITKKSEGQPTVWPLLESMISKRAGFLNLSSESKQNEQTNKDDVPDTTTEYNNPTPAQQSSIEEQTKSFLVDIAGSQSYLVSERLE